MCTVKQILEFVNIPTLQGPGEVSCALLWNYLQYIPPSQSYVAQRERGGKSLMSLHKMVDSY